MKLADKVQSYLDKINKENPKLNIFLHLNSHALQEAKALDKKPKKGRLYGYVFGIKSNINVQGLPANCASKTLENYIAPYDATVIEKIKSEDGLIIGMLNCDEFACGSSGESSAFGSDTGGSIRNPASHCGVIGLKPSYALVSRYGLIDLSMSLDQIGPLAKSIDEIALVLDVIKGQDKNDTTTLKSEPIKLETPKKLTLGILKLQGVDKNIQTLIDKKVKEAVKKYKWQTKEINIKHINLAVQTYYPLVYVEFFSGTRRFDGRRYGKKIEDSCGPEVLRRILGGSLITKAEYRGRYYQKALEMKEVIKEEFESAFKSVDAIILPTTPSLPWNIGQGAKMSPEEIYASDALTIPANLAEITALSMPAGQVSKIPVGLQIYCAKGAESKLLSIAKEFEKL